MTQLQNGWTRLLQLLLYGGLTKEQYQKIAPCIDEANRKSLVVIPGMCALFYFVRLNLGYARLSQVNRAAYLVAVVVFAYIALMNLTHRRTRRVVHLTAYLFLAVYLGVGIVSAVGPGGVQERTTLYLVFVSAAPMLFALNAAELAAVILPAECVYLVLIWALQAQYPVYATNRGNSIFISLSGLLLGVYMANQKVSGIYSAYLTLRMDEIERLNTELNQSREELRHALAEAEQANHAKTVFLNSMSHDIRTPMNAILGFTALAQRRSDDPAQVQEYLGKIMLSGQHLLALINDVLDMSRIESGTVHITPQPLHLPDVLDELCTILQPTVQEKQQQFQVETGGIRSPDVLADKLRLNQILLNILGNAVKFTPQGGTIRLCVTQPDTAPDGSADFVFTVQDTGIGMSPEFRQHIFEAFSREETPTVHGIQGTGLGMAITKNLVDLMQGSITVESTEGKGSTFTVALRFALAQGPVQAAAPAAAVPMTGRRILLAEDNALNQEIAVAILQENGFAVEVAGDGAAAVEAVQNAAPGWFDLVLMDVQMPRMDGYEATKAIRALPDPARAGIPILAMTANAFEEDRQAALAAGMNGHLAKPLDIPRLLDTLQQVLG